jgi:hypothetical protein
MKALGWRWHRLTAMSPAEIGLHFRKKILQKKEMLVATGFSSKALKRGAAFPLLLYPTTAPEDLVQAREQQWASIRAGHWEAFAWMPLQVDLPPCWQKDYKAAADLESSSHGYNLNHRALPDGADVKLIWELSRWHEITKAAQHAWLSDDEEAAMACKKWLRDWATRNPPFRGYNWTSALESGMRLIQLVWIDALLAKFQLPGWDEVISNLVYPHLHYTWNFRSFGSSANNHLLGELAGLILAKAHWPELAAEQPGLERLRGLMDREILAQFAPDGGNLEQALNYQLFSFEFCWLSKIAFEASKLPLSPEAVDRLRLAGEFFAEMHVAGQSWPYGDSDDAFVTPLFGKTVDFREEWQAWFRNENGGDAIAFWIGPFSKETKKSAPGALSLFPQSGHAIQRKGDWTLRWDFSPLGYLSTAAHGHLDALHVSLWHKGAAILVDPGTGAYYGDTKLRSFLASAQAHNGPWPTGWDRPRRLGPFLWSEHHRAPALVESSAGKTVVQWNSGCGTLRRVTEELPNGWEIADTFEPGPGAPETFEVFWQFAPGLEIAEMDSSAFQVKNGPAVIQLEFSGFEKIQLISAGAARQAGMPARGICSRAFRSVEFSDGILLTARGGNSCLLKSRFIALSPQ